MYVRLRTYGEHRGVAHSQALAPQRRYAIGTVERACRLRVAEGRGEPSEFSLLGCGNANIAARAVVFGIAARKLLQFAALVQLLRSVGADRIQEPIGHDAVNRIRSNQ